MRKRKRKYKYPCIQCKTKPVTKNQDGIECNICKKWVHLKCTDLTRDQFDTLVLNADSLPFFCLICKPRALYADIIFDNDNTSSELSNSLTVSPDNTYDSECEFSPAHDSDFEYVDDSDSDDRGLDFDSLPSRNNLAKQHANIPSMHKHISMKIQNFKYPCVICHRPCKENVQNSIACSICDCWTHQKCTNLSLSEFDKFCDPENSELRFYCQICMYGTECNKENQTCLTASDIGLIDPNDIYNLSQIRFLEIRMMMR